MNNVINDNEITTLILAIGVIIFSLLNFQAINKITKSRRLYGAFIVACLAWVFTVVEGIVAADVFNYLEHICYAASSLIMLSWLWKSAVNGHEVGR